MMGFVVPQIVGFIRNMKMDLPFTTTSLIATSDFFAAYWYLVLSTPIVLFIIYKTVRKMSDEAAYKLDSWMLKMPIAGKIIRKINVARFCQTFGAMFSSGIDVLKALKNARSTVNNLALIDALEGVEEQVRNGSPLSEAFNASGEFPSLVIRMLKVGEESGDLTTVLDQVADFYTTDVDEAIQGLIAMIEPSLTALLGGMILWIAVAVFGPIYGSFSHLDT
jgi:type IV pilus assembly protein PilC